MPKNKQPVQEEGLDDLPPWARHLGEQVVEAKLSTFEKRLEALERDAIRWSMFAPYKRLLWAAGIAMASALGSKVMDFLSTFHRGS